LRSLGWEVKDTGKPERRLSFVWAGKGAQVVANFIANLAKAGEPLLLRAFEISGISEAVMNPTDGPRENAEVRMLF
jgi:hypothetical protein